MAVMVAIDRVNTFLGFAGCGVFDAAALILCAGSVSTRQSHEAQSTYLTRRVVF